MPSHNGFRESPFFCPLCKVGGTLHESGRRLPTYTRSLLLAFLPLLSHVTGKEKGRGRETSRKKKDGIFLQKKSMGFEGVLGFAAVLLRYARSNRRVFGDFLSFSSLGFCWFKGC